MLCSPKCEQNEIKFTKLSQKIHKTVITVSQNYEIVVVMPRQWAMAMTQETNMTDISTDEHGWLNNVDVNTELSDHERKLYEAYREARKAAGQARAAFEAAMNANAPEGERIVFNYRFGGLSVKRVNGEYKAKPTKPAKPRQSLSDYLNQYPTR